MTRFSPSVWWPITGALAVLGLFNFPAAWVLHQFDEREWMPGACVCVGCLAAQVFIIALAFGCSQGAGKERLLWAYGLALVLFLLWAGGIIFANQTGIDFFGFEGPAQIIGLSGCVLVALLVGAWLPISLIRDERHVQFIPLNSAGEPLAPTGKRSRWSIADMLLATTLIASLLGLARLARGPFDGIVEFVIFALGLFTSVVFAGMCSFLTMIGVLIFCLHYRPRRALWRPQYTLATLPLPLLMIVPLWWYPQTEVTFFLIAFAVVVLSYATAIAATFAILELCGWKLEWHARS